MLVRGILLLAALGVAGCPSSSAVQCEDESFCPAGTSCGGAGRCLVRDCAGFDDKAPCFLESGPGFCAAGSCQAAIDIAGRVTTFTRPADSITGARIEALDRAWMDVAETISFGEFHLPAIAGDSGVVLEVRVDNHVPLRLRALNLSDIDYVINGDPAASLPLPTDEEAINIVTQLVSSGHDRALGYVGVVVGGLDSNDDLRDIGGAQVTLTGTGQRIGPNYFNQGGLAPARTTTSVGNGTAIFVEVEPGTYTLSANAPTSTGCVAAGADGVASVELTVLPDTLTWAGWFVCTPE